MLFYFIRLMINIFDLFIYRKYLETFLEKRKTSVEFSVLLLIICEVVASAINQIGNNWLNFLTFIIVRGIYICQYSGKVRTKVTSILLYMGLTVVAEPVGYLIYLLFAEKLMKDEMVSYYFITFMIEVFLACVIEVFCRIKSEKNICISMIPKEVTYVLMTIPFASLISCFMLMEVTKELFNAQTVVLCMCIIFTIAITNYMVFMMISKFADMVACKHEDEMLRREIKYRDEYYQDIERYQERIQDIKHDMKNQLMALYGVVELGMDDAIRNALKNMVNEIGMVEESIYSSNPVLNSILKDKASKAKENGIKIRINAFIPKKVTIEPGDMGVLYGNLLDNAIEACCKVNQEERFIEFETKYQKQKLLITIRNSKVPEKNTMLCTTKEDKRAHGRGIQSVRKVAERYNGNVLLKDEQRIFEANVLLTGIACQE